MEPHPVVSREAWLDARRALLAEEKELTRRRDRLNAKRRELPWVAVDKDYRFDGPDGEVTLADLFDGRSQLIVQHFMLGPGWSEGCVGCSFSADHIDSALVHLRNHDVAVTAVSRAPWAEIAPFRERMGWRFPWVSSNRSDFNYDFHVSFRPDEIAGGGVWYNFAPADLQSEEMSGTSVFTRDAQGRIFHTYSTYARGDEQVIATYMLLDMTPKGRNETGPGFDLTDWVRHHDRYEGDGRPGDAGREGNRGVRK